MGNNNELLDDFGKLSEPINSKDAIKQDLIKLRGIQLVFFAIGLILCFFVIYYILEVFEEGDQTKLEVVYGSVIIALMFIVPPIYLTAGTGAILASIESLTLSTLFLVPKKTTGLYFWGYFVASIIILSLLVCFMGTTAMFICWIIIMIFLAIICSCFGIVAVDGYFFISLELSLLGLSFLVGLAYCLNRGYKLLEIDIRAYYNKLAEK